MKKLIFKPIVFVFILNFSFLSFCILDTKKEKCVFNHPIKGAKCNHTYILPASGVAPRFYAYNQGIIDSIEHFLEANKVVILGVKVHSCVTGSEISNLRVTDFIKEILYKHFTSKTSIDTSRIKITSMGEQDPIMNEKEIKKYKSNSKGLKMDFQKNRRFEFEVLGYKLD